jgi:chromosomal replication initiator protein
LQVLNSVEKNIPQKAFFAVIQQKVNPNVFDTWFKPLEIQNLDHDAQVLHVFAPNTIIRDFITKHYGPTLEETLAQVDLTGYHIEWTVTHAVQPDLPISNPVSHISGDAYLAKSATAPALTKTGAGHLSGAPAAQAAGVATAPAVPRKQEEAAIATLLEKAPARDLTAANIPTYAGAPNSTLNPKYTFQSFVVGACNEFAHAAAMSVADSPGKTYNPLYLYGGVGLGKTHLMQAVGASIRESNPDLRVSYISLESFMNELITAIRYGYDKTKAFRERYRSIDVLLMDDIQFITGKERTQVEFFHTFNALYESQRQIVISSDCPPREIPDIEERLHSRFEWGLIADIEPPDLETKIAILKRKADSEGVILPDDVALYIASSVKHNIRELEGSLVRLLAMASLRGLPITRMLAQDAVRSIAEPEEDSISLTRIQRTVAAHYRKKPEDLAAKSNARHIALPRQVAMYLCKRLTKHSFPEIGRHFGGKHHTTVMHSVEKIERRTATDPEFHKLVSGLMDRLCR